MRLRFLLTLAALLCAGACNRAAKRAAAEMTGGNPDRGAIIIAAYGCGSCHQINGITGARGLTGPPLTGIATRLYIAGKLQNTPVNLERWVKDPQAVTPQTIMPMLGVTDRDVVDIAAYLYSLK